MRATSRIRSLRTKIRPEHDVHFAVPLPPVGDNLLRGPARKAAAVSLFVMAMLVLPLVLSMCPDPVLAETAAARAFQEANRLYEQGEYQQAISQYRQIIDRGVENGYVYYNLGNAYFQTRQLGPAILSYERAMRLIPRDEDVRANLEYSRLLTVDKIETPQPGWIAHLLAGFLGLFSLLEMTIVAWVLYLVLATAVIVFALNRSQRVKAVLTQVGIVLLILLALSVVMLSAKIRAAESTQAAIVMVSKVDARSGPGGDYTKMFTLHEGTKVRIRQTREGWHLVSIPGGTGGWVESEAVDRI